MENEKDKIRKELIRYLPLCDDISKDTKERWISWLENQKTVDIKAHGGSYNNPYDMSFEEAQEYTSHRGFDIPMNDGDVFVDERYITQTIGNILKWADDNPKT